MSLTDTIAYAHRLVDADGQTRWIYIGKSVGPFVGDFGPEFSRIGRLVAVVEAPTKG